MGEGSGIAAGCGRGCRCGSDRVLPWPCGRSRNLPYAAGMAVKTTKNQKDGGSEGAVSSVVFPPLTRIRAFSVVASGSPPSFLGYQHSQSVYNTGISGCSGTLFSCFTYFRTALSKSIGCSFLDGSQLSGAAVLPVCELGWARCWLGAGGAEGAAGPGSRGAGGTGAAGSPVCVL